MEEKKNKLGGMKITKLLTITLTIMLITMVSFFGVYTQKRNKMENQVKQYSFAMDLNGARMITLTNTGTKEVKKDSEGNIVEDSTNEDENTDTSGYTTETVNVNSDEVLNIENYKKTKDILEKRLKKLDVEEYNIRLNETTGEIIIELAENDKTDEIISQLTTIGKFEIIDSETKEVLLNNDNIESSEVLYNTTTSGTSIYMQITFDKEGKEKLHEISKTYKKIESDKSEDNTEEENAEESTDDEQSSDEENGSEENAEEQEENENEENTDESAQKEDEENPEENNKSKQITMKMDDDEITTTSFEEELTTGKLQLSVGQASNDNKVINDYANNASQLTAVLNSGNLPIEYKVEGNQYILSDIETDSLKKLEIGIAIIIGIALIVLIIKYKLNGLLAGISFIGFVSIFMLIIRYTNIVVSMETILGVCVTIAINYIFTILLLNNITKHINDENIVKKATKSTFSRFALITLPVYIMAIVFSFMKWTTIGTLGMVIFWGITIIAIYNLLVTKLLLKIKLDR